MIRQLMENTNYAMRHEVKPELLSKTDHDQYFSTFFVKNEVFMGKMRTKHLIFDVKTRDYYLVLGQPCLNSV